PRATDKNIDAGGAQAEPNVTRRQPELAHAFPFPIISQNLIDRGQALGPEPPSVFIEQHARSRDYAKSARRTRRKRKDCALGSRHRIRSESAASQFKRLQRSNLLSF